MKHIQMTASLRRLLASASLTAPLLILSMPMAELTAADRTPLVVIEQDLVLIDGEQAAGQIVAESASEVSFLRPGRSIPDRYLGSRLRIIQRRQSATVAATRHVEESLAENDVASAEEAARWALQRGAPQAGLMLARKILEKHTSIEAAETALDIMALDGDSAGQITLAESILAKDPKWLRGYADLVRLHQAAGNMDQVKSLVARWAEVNPTGNDVNRVKASLAEAEGDRRSAQESYGRLWRLHKDSESGTRFIVLALQRGERSEAGRVARTLLSAGVATGPAKAVLGTVLAMDGDNNAEAAGLLTASLEANGLDPALTKIVKHNLAILAARSGSTAIAMDMLSGLTDPVSGLALAMLRGESWNVPMPTALGPVVQQLNTAVFIRERRFAEAAALQSASLGGTSGGTSGESSAQRFMGLVALMLKDPSEANVRSLEGYASEESLRWQAYGHLISSRWDACERLLARLRPDDGYAAVYRVYVAAGRREPALAKQRFALISEARNPAPPAAYAARLAASYETAELDRITDTFDWPSQQIATGWQVLPGPGVTWTAEGGKLTVTGVPTQAGGGWAWRLLPAERLRRVEAEPVPGVGHMGFFLTNEERSEGLVLGVIDGNVAWAKMTAQGPGSWTTVRPHVPGQSLILRCDNGRAAIIDPEDPTRETALTVVIPQRGLAAVGVYANSVPGETMTSAMEELRTHLKVK